MMSRVTNMPKRYRSIREPFDQTFRGTTTERPRPIICGSFVNTNMGFAVSKIYIKQYFDENARNQVYSICLFVLNEYVCLIFISH
jgi:predicted metalloendopeptidase